MHVNVFKDMKPQSTGFGCDVLDVERKDKWGIPDKWINIQYHRWLTTDTYTLPSQQPTKKAAKVCLLDKYLNSFIV